MKNLKDIRAERLQHAVEGWAKQNNPVARFTRSDVAQTTLLSWTFIDGNHIGLIVNHLGQYKKIGGHGWHQSKEPLLSIFEWFNIKAVA